MDPNLVFLLIAVAIIVVALLIGRLFKRTVNKQLPGPHGGTGVGIGVDVAHGARAKGWLGDKNNGFDGNGDGGGE